MTLLFLTTTLMMTMSRGAIYALGLGVLVMIIVRWFKGLGRGVIILAAGVVISLLVQGSMAAMNPRVEETFIGATSKSIHQLSLGLVDIRPKNVPVNVLDPPLLDTPKSVPVNVPVKESRRMRQET